MNGTDVADAAACAVNPPPWRASELVALAIILGVAAFVRFHRIGEHSFWIDEFFTVEIVNGTGMAGSFLVPDKTVLDPAPDPTAMHAVRGWWHILWPDGQDNHPPLFYLLTRGWVSVAGYSEAGFRSHAAVWSIAGIALLHVLLRWRGGVAVGLWAAAIMALAEPQIQLAQNARSYPMFVTMSLWACLLVTAIEKRGSAPRRWWALTLVLLASFLTHYVAFGVIAALGAYALLCLRGAPRRAVITACATSVIAFALIWGWAIRIQSHGQAARDPAVFHDDGPDHLLMTLYRFASVPAQLFNEPPPGWTWLAPAGLLLLPLSFVFLPRRREAMFWGLWFLGGTLPAAAADVFRHSMRLDIVRYTIVAAPAVYALTASIATVRHLRSAVLRHVIPAAAVFSCAVSIPVAYRHGGMPDWRRFGREGIGRIARPGDLILIAPTTTEDLMYSVLYTCGTHYGRPLRGPVLVLRGPATADLWTTIARFQGVCVITDDLENDGIYDHVRVTAARYFPLVGQVYRFEQAPPAEESHAAAAASSQPARP